jgi:signal transduction histidine kinase
MIQGYAEAMRDIPDEVTPENMQIIIDETTRLSSMVNEVLDFSRLRTGNLELEEAPFNLTEQIREIVRRIGRMTAVDGYNVVFDEAQDRVVKGDSKRISQVLYNLLENAVKFSIEGGSINVRTLLKKGTIIISIKDNGIGIPKEDLGKIFDRFYKSDLSRGRDKSGSGLGLSICREILKAHKQDIDVVSTEGAGTTFSFSLQTK